MTNDELVRYAVTHTMSGLHSEFRAVGRSIGLAKLHVAVDLSEVHARVSLILLGLHDPTVVVPTHDELRDKWLKEHFAGATGTVILSERIVLEVVVPPPRKAHAR